MAKRLTDKDLHPSILKSVIELTSGYSSGMVTDPRLVKAASKHSQVWFSEYWKGFTLWLACIIPAIGLGLALPEGTPKAVKAVTILSCIALWMFAGYAAYKQNQKIVTWDEIEAIRPGLDLTDHQNLYLDCLQSVEESKILDENQRATWRDALYHALDQAMVLQALAEDMKSSAGGKNHVENLKEIERLEELEAKTVDPVAKTAYTESLAMARDRLSKWDSIASQAERTEAHLELTRQTFLKTRDTLRGLTMTQQNTVHVDLEPLRANLARVQSDAHDIQRALEELRQI
ncbi:MAG TPA: hypothetical protein VK171_16295 [Fimbriimonas sp.]|nr:hypothetical protein [Fimbriimonas sp.]